MTCETILVCASVCCHACLRAWGDFIIRTTVHKWDRKIEINVGK